MFGLQILSRLVQHLVVAANKHGADSAIIVLAASFIDMQRNYWIAGFKKTVCLPKEVLQDGDTRLLEEEGWIKYSCFCTFIPPDQTAESSVSVLEKDSRVSLSLQHPVPVERVV